MKTKRMVMALVLAISGMVNAAVKQDEKPCKRIEKLQAWMNDSLGLTADQQARIAVINDSACTQIQAIKASNNGDKEANRARIQKVMQNNREAYKKVLTDQQIQKLTSHLKEGRKAKKMDPAKRSEKMTQKMKTELGLSDDQTLKVKAANDELANKLVALRAKRDAGTDKAQLKSEAKAIRTDYDAKIKTILTTEQLGKWEKMKAEAKEKHKQNREKK